MRKVYFHGGGWMDSHMTREPFYMQLEKVLQKEQVTQVLHVPFSRMWVWTKAYRRKEWWFQDRFPHIQFYNALYREDLHVIDPANVFVLMTWWSDKMHLYLTIKGNPFLEEIIRTAPYLFWSSAGMMVLWTHFRSHKDYKVTHPWLWLFNFVWEGHLTKQRKQAHLEYHLEKFSDIDFVLGIDEDTVVELDESWNIITSWGEWSYLYLPWISKTQDIPDWRDKIKNSLQKTVVCTSYIDALDRVNSLTNLVEKENHHPDISIKSWNQLTISLTTHDAWNTITQKDLDMAKKINQFFSR